MRNDARRFRNKDCDYDEISHTMEKSLINLGDLQGEEFIIDNENEDVKGAWVPPIIQKDMI